MMGRSPEMFQYADIPNVSEHYLAKARRALTRSTLYHNPYLEYIFSGNYYSFLPAYLQKTNTEKVKRAQLEIVTRDLLSYLEETPDNHFTQFNLSDVFEPMTQEKTDRIFEHILRTGRNGARLIFWNNLVKRDIPQDIKKQFRKEVPLEEELRKTDKVFFYESFHIYTLIK